MPASAPDASVPRTASPAADDQGRSYPAWVTALARRLLRTFFGRVEVVGAAQVDTDRPLLVVANHNNGLVDAVLMVGLVPGRPRFIGKSTLWKNPALRPFLALGRVIPVHRPQDGTLQPGGNDEMFERCRAVLRDGGAIALFPEGKSHSEPSLSELKTGAARIVLGLPPEVQQRLEVVPVGLHYDAPGVFRSRVLVLVGEPIPAVEEGAAPAAAGDSEAVRELTDRIADALGGVTLGYRSWDEARLLERAADLLLVPDPELPAQPAMADRFAVRRQVLAAYRGLVASRPERLEPLARALARYDRLLQCFGLRDEQVGSAYPLPSVARFALESIVLLLVRLPLAAIGALLGWIPYRLCGWIGSRVAHQPDMPASYKLFGGILLLPLWWIAEAVFAGWRWGWPWALAVLVLAPSCGWVAIRFRDRFGYLLTEARAYLLLRGPGRLGDELRSRRDAVLHELRALAAEVGVGAPAGGSS